MNECFFIYNFSSKVDDDVDLSFLPMLTRRKLSKFDKIALYNLYKCYEKDNVRLVFASRFSDMQKADKLIEQYTTQKEVSPILFSSSLHNCAVGTFSILNKITKTYNSVSAGENSLSEGLLDAVLNKEKTLFCYCDTYKKIESVACLIGKEPKEGAVKVEFIKGTGDKNDTFDDFCKFLKGENKTFTTRLYKLERLEKRGLE